MKVFLIGSIYEDDNMILDHVPTKDELIYAYGFGRKINLTIQIRTDSIIRFIIIDDGASTLYCGEWREVLSPLDLKSGE